MKKIIIKLSKILPQKEMKSLRDELEHQWREGFMLLPEYCGLEFVDQEWCDASKMAPKNWHKVLCYCEVNENQKEYAIGWREGGSWRICLDDEDIDKVGVLAWMPLPLPYEG